MPRHAARHWMNRELHLAAAALDQLRQLTHLMLVVDPKAPNSTFVNDRFIALLINTERMKPDEPSSDPLMMRMTLPIANPVAHDANPEYEFNRATTTGMSAPPIGSTSRMPN